MKFKRRVTEIEAFQYCGDLMDSNGDWLVPYWAQRAYVEGTLFYGYKDALQKEPPYELFVDTVGGRIEVAIGDYVLWNLETLEVYPRSKELFEKEYEPA